LVIVAALAASALADDKPAEKTPPKRAMPVYDGRAEEGTRAIDVLHTAGRVVLFPAWVVVNYGIRWPLGKFITWAENSHGLRHVVNVWFLGPPTPTMSIFPIVLYDFGFQPSVGVRMLWEDGFATPGSRFSFKLGVGGTDWYRADVGTRIALPQHLKLWADVSVRHRPDQLYYGPGSNSPAEAKARFADTRGAATLAFGWTSLNVFVQSAATAATESRYGGNSSISDRVADGLIPRLPTGYNELLLSHRGGIRLALDTRSHKRIESGARLDATIERVTTSRYTTWTHYDIKAGGALKLDKVGERLLDIRARLQLIESDHIDDVPFTELAAIGGAGDLRGFANGRARGASAMSVMVDYQWPLAAWLDATLYLGSGNVFGENLGGFDLQHMRGSLGLGLGLAGLSDDRQIELWSALGFEPLGGGVDPSNFRLVLAYAYDY
jgi:hypothetical protein